MLWKLHILCIEKILCNMYLFRIRNSHIFPLHKIKTIVRFSSLKNSKTILFCFGLMNITTQTHRCRPLNHAKIVLHVVSYFPCCKQFYTLQWKVTTSYINMQLILLAHLHQSAVLSRITTNLQKIRPVPDAEH